MTNLSSLCARVLQKKKKNSAVRLDVGDRKKTRRPHFFFFVCVQKTDYTWFAILAGRKVLAKERQTLVDVGLPCTSSDHWHKI